MTYLPPDARVNPDFTVVRGMGDTVYREKVDIRDIHDGTDSLPDTVTVGTPLRTIAGHDEEVYIINDETVGAAHSLVGHVVGVYVSTINPAKPAADKFAGFAFADYDKTGAVGMPSANFQNAVTNLRGEYVVKISRDMFLETAGKLFQINSVGPVNLTYNNTLAVGADVVVCNYISAADAVGTPILVTLYSDWNARYTTPTPEEIAVDNAVIGKIIKLDSDFVTIRVSC